jgi:Protein of unknown function (DUF2844)
MKSLPAPRRAIASLVFGCLGALSAPLANAALGEPEASTQSDAATFQGSVKVQERAGYKVHEITSISGTVVHEFVGSDGTVFAVAWSGPQVPNLRQALGKYFDAFVAGAKSQPRNHRHLQVEQENLVVRMSGHMRAMSGLAYLPQSLPAGIDLGALR